MTDTRPRNAAPLILAARLYPRTSRNGRAYLTGRLGGVRVLILPKRDDDPGEHSHELHFGAAPPREREP